VTRPAGLCGRFLPERHHPRDLASHGADLRRRRRRRELEFKHRWVFDVASGGCYDGGVVEYSTNGGTNWYDILSGAGDNDPSTSANVPRFLQGGYNGTLSGADRIPRVPARVLQLLGGSFQTTRVDLGGFAGQNVRFRWRMGTGYQIGEVGWNLTTSRSPPQRRCAPLGQRRSRRGELHPDRNGERDALVDRHQLRASPTRSGSFRTARSCRIRS